MMTLHSRRIFALAAILLAGQGTGAAAGLAYFPGTGHWYEAVRVAAGVTWNEAVTNALSRGGYLCALTNAAENSFAASLVDITYYSDVSINGDILGPWLGGFRHANQSNWQWLTGEPFTYLNWYPGQPDGYGGSEQRLQFYNRTAVGSTWGDHPGDPLSGYSLPRGYIVEYDQLPRLGASSTNGLVMISWPRPLLGWVLETTGPLLGATNNWTEVPAGQYLTNAASQFITVTNPLANALYRLRR
jgi:hypothetical protein